MKLITQYLRTPAALAKGIYMALCLGVVPPASAGNDVWTGGSSSGNNWTDAANWGGVSPVAGDWLFFDGSIRTAPNNNFSAGTAFGTLIFNGGADAFTLGGNSITLPTPPAAEYTGALIANYVGGSITNNSASTETIGLPLTLANGHHNINSASTLNLGRAITLSNAASTSFSTGVNVSGSGLTPLNGILGGWATMIPPTTWATLDGSGNVVGLDTFTDVSPGGTIANAPANNLRILDSGANITLAAAGTTTINTLLFGNNAAAANQTVDVAAGRILRFGSKGGILNATRSTGTSRILTIGTAAGTGFVTAGGADNTPGDLYLIETPFIGNTGNQLVMNSRITNNGTAGVTVHTFGHVSFPAAHSYSGGTYIHGGRIQTTPNFQGTGPIYIYPGGQLFFNANGTCTNDIFMAGYGNAESSGNGAIRMGGTGRIITGTITLTADAASANGTFNGRITGPGSFIVGAGIANGVGTTIMGGTNDYSGDTLINGTNANAASTLQMTTGRPRTMPHGPGKGNLVLRGISATLAATFNLNGTDQTVNGLNSMGVEANTFVNSGVAGPATLTVGDGDANGDFGGVIQDNLGVVGLTKIGAGTQVLSGACTYTGTTTVSGGSLVIGTGQSFPTAGPIIINNNAKLDISALPSVTIPSLTMSNGTLVVGVAQGAAALTTSNLTVLGTTNFITITAIPGIPSYPVQIAVLQGANLNGTLNFVLGGPLPPSPGTPYAGTLVNNLANKSVDLRLTAGPAQVTWVGYGLGALGSAWDIGNTANWRDSLGQPTTYADGEFVRFDDSANRAITTLYATVRPAAITVSNSTLNYLLNDDGGGRYITGSGDLFKQGTAKLTLDNSGINDFSGGVTVGAGTLQIGNNDAAGNLPAASTVVNNGTLVFARTDSVTVSNVISGTGTLSQNASGTLNLAGANTFTGAVTVAQGTLQVGDNSALGTTNGATTIASGATLDVNGSAGNTRRLGSERIIVGGAGVGGAGAIVNSGGEAYPAISFVTLTANTVFGGSGRWDLRATGSGTADPATAALSTSGQPYNLTKVGGNEVVIANATIDPALANIDIQQGIFQVNGWNTGLGNPANTLTIEPGATFSMFDTTNLLNKKILLADTATFENTHGANTVVGPITLNGVATFNVANAPLTLNGTLGGPGVLTKIGQLPLNLNGDGSALTGGVNINVGTLAVNGKLGCGLTNQSTGVLVGGGTINGPVDTTGAVFPGASNVVGTLTTGPLILEGGSPVYFDLGYDTTAGSGSNDLIVVNGDLTVNGNTININPLSLLHRGIPYTLFTYTGKLIWNGDLSFTDTIGYTYTASTNTAGQVRVVATGGPPIWNGGSATTSNWSDAANWGGVAIAPGNFLWFTASNRLSNNNDTSGGTSYGGIGFNTDAGAFVLNGNAMDLAGNIVNQSPNLQTIKLNLTFAGSRTIDGGAAGLTVGGGITNTAAFTTLTLAGKGTLTNLLYSADPNSLTNILSVASNANWTLVDNAASAPITVPWQFDVVGGTFNFGTASSAPNLTSTTINGVPQDTRVGNVGGAVATFNMVNGTFTTASRLNTGTAAGATGVVNQVSGTLNIRQQFQGANGAATAGSAVNLSGGTMNIDTAATGQFYVASRGPGSLTLSGSGVLNCGTLDVSRSINSSIPGVVNLNGGTLAPTRVGTATANAGAATTGSTATFNFNGGTLKARASSATFFQGSTVAPIIPITTIVKSGGAVIDTDTNAISILEPMQHDSTLGATLDGGLIKLGVGTLTLTAANTFTGPARVNAGTLAINGTSAAGNAVTVNSGGTLGGTGTCGGTVTVASGGTLAPGNSIGTLTVSSNVFLQAGSTTFMEINRGPAPINDILRCTGGTINLGGALVVTNIGAALQSGDTFTLFTGTLSGAISADPASLPPLASGLGWDTSKLNSLGRISVTTASVPPSITGVSVAGGNFTMSGSGGQAGAAYRVVASTNAALPLNSWVPVATNNYDATGKFNVSIPINPLVRADFYRVVSP